jgi:hypothetical protein
MILKLRICYKSFPKFSKPRDPIKFLGARRVAYGKFHTQDLQMFGATVQNLLARVDQKETKLHSIF